MDYNYNGIYLSDLTIEELEKNHGYIKLKEPIKTIRELKDFLKFYKE